MSKIDKLEYLLSWAHEVMYDNDMFTMDVYKEIDCYFKKQGESDMKNTIEDVINEKIEEYTIQSAYYSDTSAFESNYYEGKAEGLREALELIKNIK